MSEAFNADEVLRMAEEIEKNGGTFYREAATKTSNRRSRTMFLNMASMEDGHLRIFEPMRRILSAEKRNRSSILTTRRPCTSRRWPTAREVRV